jgi:hypothetical protein
LSGLQELIDQIENDLKARFPKMHKARRRALAELCGVMIFVRSANTMELGAGLPRDIARPEDRYQFIERFLNNEHINCGEIFLSFAVELIKKLIASGEPIIFMLDQSHINDTNEVLMLSVRVGDRALPIAWRVRSTQGGIGFSVQEELLNAVKAALPAGIQILLAADRFYGTPALIKWCQKAGWKYRIRLKGNFTLKHEGGSTTTGEAAINMPDGVKNADLCCSGVITNIGIIHEKGHPEPWIIAMSDEPNRETTLEYGLRWGIEPMFSDFKSRGFGLMQSQIYFPERLERLILIMSIAMYWTVSCGLSEDQKFCEQKRTIKQKIGKLMRSACSYFTTGLRFFRTFLAKWGARPPIPSLWACLNGYPDSSLDDLKTACCLIL